MSNFEQRALKLPANDTQYLWTLLAHMARALDELLKLVDNHPVEGD